jgi:Zn-finger domain-containing protein
VKLLGVEKLGHRVQKYWLHTDGMGKDQITVETIEEDVEPIFDAVKRRAQAETSRSFFRLKAELPVTMLDDLAKLSAKDWGVSVKQAFEEIMKQKTDRAKKALRLLTDGRDFNKFQAKTYR